MAPVVMRRDVGDQVATAPRLVECGADVEDIGPSDVEADREEVAVRAEGVLGPLQVGRFDDDAAGLRGHRGAQSVSGSAIPEASWTWAPVARAIEA
jgi:hypothetical protein